MPRVPLDQIPFSLAEAALLLGISKRRMFDLVARGHVEGAYKTSGDRGHWRLARQQFLSWRDRFVAGEIRIPRNRKATKAPPKKGGLANALRSLELA